MEVIVSARHMSVDDSTREHAQERLVKLQQEYHKLTTARVVLDMERSWCVAEIHLNGKHLALDAKAKTRDVLVSIDSAVDKLEKQLRRHVERIQEHRVSKGQPTDAIADVDVEDDFEDELEDDFEDVAALQE